MLGRLEAQVRGKLIPPPAHPAGPALLGWLALHPGEHPRGGLATLLWPEMSLSNARAQLRSAVWALRRALGPCEGEVLDEPTTIGLRCTTDLQAFDALLEAGDRAGALALRRGPLLDGLDEHPWVLSARAEHERRLARVEAP